MSLDKSEIKLSVLHDLGCRLDDLLEEAQNERLRADGASSALVQASKAITRLTSLVDDDVEKKRYDDDTAAKVKEYLDRCAVLIDSMALNTRNHRIATVGRGEAFDVVVKVLKKEHDAEIEKRSALSDNAEKRPIGQRPADTLKQQRLSEDVQKPVKRRTVSLKNQITKRKSKSDYAKDT